MSSKNLNFLSFLGIRRPICSIVFQKSMKLSTIVISKQFNVLCHFHIAQAHEHPA